MNKKIDLEKIRNTPLDEITSDYGAVFLLNEAYMYKYSDIENMDQDRFMIIPGFDKDMAIGLEWDIIKFIAEHLSWFREECELIKLFIIKVPQLRKMYLQKASEIGINEAYEEMYNIAILKYKEMLIERSKKY